MGFKMLENKKEEMHRDFRELFAARKIERNQIRSNVRSGSNIYIRTTQ
jgi:hypothetical protein